MSLGEICLKPFQKFFEKARKRCWLLLAYNDLITQAKRWFEGNPCLLDWLINEVLLNDDSNAKIRLKFFKISSEECRKIIWEELHQQFDNHLEQIVSHCLIFKTHVPLPALEAACESIPNYKEHLHRAIQLGLLKFRSQPI